MFENYVLAFIPIFVAVDPIGTLPIFVALTSGIDKTRKKRIVIQSLWTAAVLAFGFILLGKGIFKVLGITLGDFMVAGGIILLCLSMIDLIHPGKERRVPDEDPGVVPIGTPLVVGPAVLTTSLLLVDQYGLIPTIVAVFVNLLIVGLVFRGSDRLIAVLGETGSRAISKVMALLLAAIAIKMIRSGVISILGLPG